MRFATKLLFVFTVVILSVSALFAAGVTSGMLRILVWVERNEALEFASAVQQDKVSASIGMVEFARLSVSEVGPKPEPMIEVLAYDTSGNPRSELRFLVTKNELAEFGRQLDLELQKQTTDPVQMQLGDLDVSCESPLANPSRAKRYCAFTLRYELK